MAPKKRSPLARVFLRGLALVLPLALTAFLLAWVWRMLDAHVITRVESAVVAIADRLGYSFQPGEWLTVGLSLLLLLVVIVLIGWWLGGFLGRRIYAVFDRILHRTPVVSAVYPHVKQITEFFLGSDAVVEFERVVAIPYPRQGLYSLAFVTGSSLKSLHRATGQDLVSVFVPSSPMPVTGYTLFVPRGELITIHMSVEEALRMVISGGVLVADRERLVSLGAGAEGAPEAAPETSDES